MAQLYGTGYIASEFDGTERVYEPGLFELPEEYDHRDTMPPVLDQGRSSKCVAYSLTSVLDWQVNRMLGVNQSNGFDIDLLYAQRKDKTKEGMMIKTALNYLRHKGLGGYKVRTYALVKSEMALKMALIANGPCVGALPVYKESQRRDFWNGSTFAGGHCITIVGYTKNGFVIRNSWGKFWCAKGHVIIPFYDFSKFYEVWTLQ